MDEFKLMFMQAIREEYSNEELEAVGKDLADFLNAKQDTYGDSGKMLFMAFLMEAQAKFIFKQSLDAIGAQEV
jgi:hypothetical protein